MPTRVSQAIGGFAQYLHGENIRIREEEKRQRQNLASQNIADAYLGLGPDADEEDVRRLTFQMIDDAANLDVMQESLPLIQSLYSESLQSMQRRKVETREDALYDFVRLQPGTEDIPESVGGSAAFELYKDERDYAKSQEITTNVDEEETMSLVVFTGKMDEQGNPIEKFRTVTGPGYQERADLQRSLQRSNFQSIKQYAGTTEDGLPILQIGPELKVQEGGQLVTYNSDIHGRIYRGAGSELKDARTLQILQKQDRSIAWQNMETTARTLGEMGELGIRPTKLPNRKELSFSQTLSSKTDAEIEAKILDIDDDGRRSHAFRLWNDYVVKRGEYRQINQDYTQIKGEIDKESALEQYGVSKDEYRDIWNNYSGKSGISELNTRTEGGALIENAGIYRLLFARSIGIDIKNKKKEQEILSMSDKDMTQLWLNANVFNKAKYINELKKTYE